MELSQRILKVKPSPTLQITALANSLKAQGLDIIGFGSGEPDFDTPQFIKDAAIKAIENGRTKYTPAGGIIELKKAVINKFQRDNNLEYNKNEVTINCGGKHSFYNLMQVLLNDGDEVIIPSPYWVSYPSMVSLAGGNPVIIETKEDVGFKINLKELEEKITTKTKAIVINSPSNPTGAAYSKEELKAIADIIFKHDILVISDDIYESIIYGDYKFSNIAQISEEYKKKTIVLNGISKTYAMTGWRIGYMAGDEKIIKKVETLQSQSTSNPTSISQWAAVEALTGDQSVIGEMVEAFTRRRKLIIDSLNDIENITCLYPDGAFYAFPGVKGIFNMPGWEEKTKKYEATSNSSKLSSFILEEAQVAVVPGIAFGTDDHIRLSFATSDENIKIGVKRIKKAIESLK